jgi:hypothetical protein
MSLRAGRAIALFLFGFSLLGAVDATTVADEASNLTLRRTYLKTQSQTVVLPATFTDAFTLTTVACPEDTVASCTVRVEVSIAFEEIEPGAVAAMRARVDGLTASPGIVELDSMSAGTLGNVRTFSWIRTGVAPGSHTVDVEFGMAGTGAAAIAGPRTLTIDVYKLPVFVGLP